MTKRTRTYASPEEIGWYSIIGGTPCVQTKFYRNVSRISKKTVDYVLPGDGHAFDSTTLTKTGYGATLTGVDCDGNQIIRVDNNFPTIMTQYTASSPRHLTISGKPSNGALAAELLAKTNPSSAVVDLPIFIFELRELPMLLKGYGDNWLKSIARGNLSYQFGIKPLIRDLQQLLNFADHFSKREKDLRDLAEGGLRRKRSLWRGTNSTSGNTGTNANNGHQGSTVSYRYTVTTSDETWGFCRWLPTVDTPRTDDAIKRAARRAVLGLTLDFSTFWEAMPWSWLIDWCSSAGAYLEAHRNIVAAEPTDIAIMSRITTEWKYTQREGVGSYPGNMTVVRGYGPYYLTWVQKLRSPAVASIDAWLPFLSLRQLSILGSIGISKYRF
jgi:hypothetical protein